MKFYWAAVHIKWLCYVIMDAVMSVEYVNYFCGVSSFEILGVAEYIQWHFGDMSNDKQYGYAVSIKFDTSC